MSEAFEKYGVYLKTINRGLTHKEKREGVIYQFTDEKEFNALVKQGTIEETQKPATYKKKINTKEEIIPEITEHITGKNYFIADQLKRFWWYDHKTGIWRENAEDYLNSVIRREIEGEEAQRSFIVKEVISRIKGLYQRFDGFPETPAHLIPFQNGVYDLQTKEIRAHDPGMYLRHVLPVKLPKNKEEASCNEINNFLTEVVSEKDKKRLIEWSAYCLFPEYRYQKFLTLHGSGCNGKGTFLRLLQTLLGGENVSGESLHDLTTKDFSCGNLWGKLVNICGDLSSMPIRDTAMIKKLTGRDLLMCNRKNKQSFPFTNTAKLVFSANEIPRTNDKSKAFFRRVDLIGFPNDFTGREIRDLDQILQAPEQLSGFALILLETLQELHDNDFQITQDKNLQEITEEYERLSNPILAAIYKVFESNPGEYVKTEEVYRVVEDYTKKNGGRKKSKIEIGRVLFEEGIEKDKVGGLHVFHGLRVREGKNPDFPEFPYVSGCFFPRIGNNLKVLESLETLDENQEKRRIFEALLAFLKEEDKGEGVAYGAVFSFLQDKCGLDHLKIGDVLIEMKTKGRIYEIREGILRLTGGS